MLRSFCSRLLQLSRTMPYYAVRIGKTPGVYQTWNECKAEVDQFPKARYKKFDTEEDAWQFVRSTDSQGGWGNRGKKAAATSGATSAASKKLSEHDLEVADGKIEVLKEKLSIAKKEKALIAKEKKLQELKGKEKSKSFTGGRHSPYGKSAASSSASWKQSGGTKPLDLQDVKQIHTDAGQDSSGAMVVYTDGACIMNGAHGASAGIGVYWGPGNPLNTSERLPGRQTNNRAEIHAVVKAVEQAKAQGIKDLHVKTDSNFLIKAMTEWIHGWKKKGWINASKKEVINKDDFQELERVSEGINITYTHVAAHTGIDGNECADKLAMAGAKKPAV